MANEPKDVSKKPLEVSGLDNQTLRDLFSEFISPLKEDKSKSTPILTNLEKDISDIKKIITDSSKFAEEHEKNLFEKITKDINEPIVDLKGLLVKLTDKLVSAINNISTTSKVKTQESQPNIAPSTTPIPSSTPVSSTVPPKSTTTEQDILNESKKQDEKINPEILREYREQFTGIIKDFRHLIIQIKNLEDVMIESGKGDIERLKRLKSNVNSYIKFMEEKIEKGIINPKNIKDAYDVLDKSTRSLNKESRELDKRLSKMKDGFELAAHAISTVASRLGIMSFGAIISRSMEFQQITQRTGTAMGGLVNSQKQITNQLIERANHIVKESKGMVDMVSAAKAQTALYEKGIGNLKTQSGLLKTSAISATELNMTFEELVDKTGNMAYDLKMTGSQVTSIIRGTSDVSKNLDMSAKKVFSIQEGVKNIYENMRRVAGESARAVLEFTNLMAGLDKMKGASEVAGDLLNTFTGGFDNFNNSLQNSGILGVMVLSKLKKQGSEALGSMSDPKVLSKAFEDTMSYLYNRFKNDPNRDRMVNLFSGGKIKGWKELENSMIAFNEKMKSTGEGAANQIKDLQRELQNTSDKIKKGEIQGKIKQLQDTLASEASASMADLESQVERIQKLQSLSGSNRMSDAEAQKELSKIWEKKKGSIKQELSLAIESGVKIEGLDKKTFDSISKSMEGALAGNVKIQDVLKEISKISEATKQSNEKTAKDQMKLSMKNALDQINAGKNVAEQDFMKFTIGALNSITFSLKFIARFSTYIFSIFGLLSFLRSSGLLTIGKHYDKGPINKLIDSIFSKKSKEDKNKGSESGIIDKISSFFRKRSESKSAGQQTLQSPSSLEKMPGMPPRGFKIDWNKARSIGSDLLYGAAAITILALGIITVGTIILKLGAGISSLLGLDSERAKKIASTVTSIITSTGIIIVETIIAASALYGIGRIMKKFGGSAGIKSVAKDILAGAAAIAILSPAVLLLGTTLVWISDKILSIFGMTPEKAEKIAKGIAGIIKSTGIILLYTLLAAGVMGAAGVGLLALSGPQVGIAIAALIAGGIALGLLTPAVLLVATAVIKICQFITGFLIDPEKASKTAKGIAGIIKSAGIILLYTLLTAGVMGAAGVGLLALVSGPQIILVAGLLTLGAIALGILTPAILLVATGIVKICEAIMGVFKMDPEKASKVAKGVAGIIKSLFTIIRYTYLASAVLASIAPMSIALLLFVPLIKLGGFVIKTVIGVILKTALSIVDSAKKIVNEKSENEANKVLKSIENTIRSIEKIISGTEKASKMLSRFSPGVFSKIFGDLKDKAKAGAKYIKSFIPLILDLSKDIINITGKRVGNINPEDASETVKGLSNIVSSLSRILEGVSKAADHFKKIKPGWFKSDLVKNVKKGADYLKKLIPVIMKNALVIFNITGIGVERINVEDASKTAQGISSIVLSLTKLLEGVSKAADHFKKIKPGWFKSNLVKNVKEGAGYLKKLIPVIMKNALVIFNMTKSGVININVEEAVNTSKGITSIVLSLAKLLESVSKASDYFKKIKPGWFKSDLIKNIKEGANYLKKLIPVIMKNTLVIFDITGTGVENINVEDASKVAQGISSIILSLTKLLDGVSKASDHFKKIKIDWSESDLIKNVKSGAKYLKKLIPVVMENSLVIFDITRIGVQNINVEEASKTAQGISSIVLSLTKLLEGVSKASDHFKKMKSGWFKSDLIKNVKKGADYLKKLIPVVMKNAKVIFDITGTGVENINVEDASKTSKGISSIVLSLLNLLEGISKTSDYFKKVRTSWFKDDLIKNVKKGAGYLKKLIPVVMENAKVVFDITGTGVENINIEEAAKTARGISSIVSSLAKVLEEISKSVDYFKKMKPGSFKDDFIINVKIGSWYLSKLIPVVMESAEDMFDITKAGVESINIEEAAKTAQGVSSIVSSLARILEGISKSSDYFKKIKPGGFLKDDLIKNVKKGAKYLKKLIPVVMESSKDMFDVTGVGVENINIEEAAKTAQGVSSIVSSLARILEGISKSSDYFKKIKPGGWFKDDLIKSIKKGSKYLQKLIPVVMENAQVMFDITGVGVVNINIEEAAKTAQGVSSIVMSFAKLLEGISKISDYFKKIKPGGWFKDDLIKSIKKGSKYLQKLIPVVMENAKVMFDITGAGIQDINVEDAVKTGEDIGKIVESMSKIIDGVTKAKEILTNFGVEKSIPEIFIMRYILGNLMKPGIDEISDLIPIIVGSVNIIVDANKGDLQKISSEDISKISEKIVSCVEGISSVMQKLSKSTKFLKNVKQLDSNSMKKNATIMKNNFSIILDFLTIGLIEPLVNSKDIIEKALQSIEDLENLSNIMSKMSSVSDKIDKKSIDSLMKLSKELGSLDKVKGEIKTELIGSSSKSGDITAEQKGDLSGINQLTGINSNTTEMVNLLKEIKNCLSVTPKRDGVIMSGSTGGTIPKNENTLSANDGVPMSSYNTWQTTAVANPSLGTVY